MSKIVALDCETTGLSPLDDKLRLIQIYDGEEAFVIDTWADDFKSYWMPYLKPMLENPLVIKCGHNLKFDVSFLKQHLGIEVTPIWDTYLAAACLQKQEKSLAMNVAYYLERQRSKEEQTSDWSKPSLTKEQIDYAKQDVIDVYELYPHMRQELIDEELVETAKLEFAAVSALSDIELNGIKVDVSVINKLKGEQQEKRSRERKAVESFIPGLTIQTGLFGDDETFVNLNSPDQKRSILARCGVHVPDTKAKTLKEYANTHEVVRHLSEYTTATKLVTSFLEPYPSLVKNDGRIHANFNAYVTKTGRIACSTPNLQQWPHDPEFRAAFIPEAGNKLIVVDVSGQELRILAEFSNDRNMIQAFNNGEDLHTKSAALMFGIPLEQVTKEQRTASKTLTFGITYGMGAGSLGKQLGESEEAAQILMDNYFAGYPGVKKWMRSIQAEGKKNGYVRSLAGRKIPLSTDNKNTTAREAVNFPIQSSAADMMKIALADLYTRFQHTHTKLVNTVHDEIVVECAEDRADEALEEVTNSLINAGKRYIKKVPVEAEGAILDAWGKP